VILSPFFFSLKYMWKKIGHSFNAFQTDGGGKFIKFKSYLSSMDIAHCLSCPHTSDQNGTAERKHCHLI